jgi:hypothetical protein
MIVVMWLILSIISGTVIKVYDNQKPFNQITREDVLLSYLDSLPSANCENRLTNGLENSPLRKDQL